MSVYISEVLVKAGYDIYGNVEDAKWLLSQVNEFEELVDAATQLEEDYEDYQYYISDQEDQGNYDNLSFNEWRASHE